MSIKRYVANKDTTITNAFKDNLTTRATDANMGASDILDIFSIYGQATTSSLEASRILLQFPVNNILSDRNNSKIGLSGSTQFILKLSNAPHGDSTPSDFDLIVSAVSSSWNEGLGLDMESYTDTGPANWLSASTTQAWNSEGGDYIGQEFVQHFDTGLEDLEIDITPLVENWLTGSISNNGIGIKLSSSLENSTTSYYVKKFFARGSEFFFKRPWIEARTRDFLKDDRNNFTISSSLLDSSDNLNTLVLYNRVKGKLKNIPSIGTGSGLSVSLYAGINAPTGVAQILHNGATKVDAGFYKTGIYTASVGIKTTSSYLFDVWFSGSTVENSSSTVFATGSIIYTKEHDASFENQAQEYIINITNLKNSYKTNEQTRFNLFAREKEWSPNLYHISSKYLENVIIEEIFYKIIRIQDNFEVIPYGTGAFEHTRMSFDDTGNYFDLDMSLLEPGYSYGIKLGYKFGDDFNEFKEIFKFRVE
jgi:hypothetical protein